MDNQNPLLGSSSGAPDWNTINALLRYLLGGGAGSQGQNFLGGMTRQQQQQPVSGFGGPMSMSAQGTPSGAYGSYAAPPAQNAVSTGAPMAQAPQQPIMGRPSATFQAPAITADAQQPNLNVMGSAGIGQPVGRPIFGR